MDTTEATRDFKPSTGAVSEALMHTFVIDAENRVIAYAGTRRVLVPTGACRFANEKELSKVADGWPGTRLVEIWNKLPNANPVRKFTDRKTALRRIWKALQELAPAPTQQIHTNASGRGKAAAKRAGGRVNTKAECIIALLKRPAGATLNEIMAETSWQAHSIRGFISGQLSKRLGLRIQSFKRDGERVYRIH
jgi:hypothetical protein